MFDIIKEYHALLRKANLRAALDKTLFFLRKEFGHVISENNFLQLYHVLTSLKT